jgi:hypothetical protein
VQHDPAAPAQHEQAKHHENDERDVRGHQGIGERRAVRRAANRRPVVPNGALGGAQRRR